MTKRIGRAGLAGLAILALAACTPAGRRPTPPPVVPKTALAPVKPPTPKPRALAPTPASAAPSQAPVGQAINASAFAPDAKSEALRNQLIKVEILLDRAHVSPGVIDGRDGGNLRQAILAYEAAHGLGGDGAVDQPLWEALTRADASPVVTDHVITDDDVKGPFIGKVPTDMTAMSKLDHMGYATPRQLLAEAFHMDQKLLAALNPGVDFSVAGTSIVVAVPDTGPLQVKVALVEVDKGIQQVRAFDEVGKLAAVYPATVGSQERPAPSGEWAVRVVAPRPDYTFDPSRLTFGKSKTKLTIAAGPNNPVGSTWIGLTKDTYGIHGAPDPTLVGKVASHGCVRLTNWAARQLGQAVKAGTRVLFVGEAARRTTA